MRPKFRPRQMVESCPRRFYAHEIGPLGQAPQPRVAPGALEGEQNGFSRWDFRVNVRVGVRVRDMHHIRLPVVCSENRPKAGINIKPLHITHATNYYIVL